MSNATTRFFSDLIQDVARPLVAATPPPRGLPYLGLDHPSGTSLDTLDRLGAHGIFRKYESLLDLGTRFGAAARWVVQRLGGDAIAAIPNTTDAVAAGFMTRRSIARHHVQCLAAAPTALPFPSARFTHVWAIETLLAFSDPAAVMREAFRVVRPGAWLGVQEILPARDAAAAHLLDIVRAAGFFELELADLTRAALQHAPQLVLARRQLDQQLRQAGAAFAAIADANAATRTALADGSARVVQLLARRPA